MIAVRDLCWAAGFIEGEGTFSVTNRINLRLAVPQVERAPLERLQHLFGGNIRWSERPRGARHIHTWSLNVTHQVAGIAMSIYGIVGPRKRAQIGKCLAAWRQPYLPHAINRRCILTPEQVHEIRSSSEPRKVLAARYGVAYNTICSVLGGYSWQGAA